MLYTTYTENKGWESSRIELENLWFNAKTFVKQRLYYCRQVQVQMVQVRSAIAVVQFWACALPLP